MIFIKHQFKFCLLFTLSGTILLLANSKQLISLTFVLPLAVTLFSVPVILIQFTEKNHQNQKFRSLLFLFVPIILINFIYHIKIGLPVGFNDVHEHMYLYSHLFDDGKILFSNAQFMSFNFVGLYTLSNFIDTICNIDIVWIASVIPAFINILVTFFVYLLANRIFSHKIAIITTLLFGWTNAVLLFGHEYRTQTLGTLFLFGTLLVMTIFYQKKNLQIPLKIILLIMVTAIVTAAFTSFFYALIIFTGILIASKLFSRNWSILITSTMVCLFCMLFLGYMMYIGNSFDTIVIAIFRLFEEFFTKEPSSIPSVGQLIYGNFVQWFTYFVWGIFIIGSIFYFKKILQGKMNILQTSIFFSFSGLFLFGFLNSIINTLNPARIYAVTTFIIALVIAYSIFKLLFSLKKQKYKTYFKILTLLFVMIYISVSLVKFPGYIIGETEPIRGQTEIDKYAYWHLDERDSSASSFMLATTNNKSIHFHMIIPYYMFKKIIDQNKISERNSIGSEGSILDYNIQGGDFIILEDNDQSRYYAGRGLLPSQTAYNMFDQLYTNGDYILYIKI